MSTRFLAEKGESVHHVAVASPKFDEFVAAQAEKGNELVLSGTFSGYRVAYLATDRDLGVIAEIFSGPPDEIPCRVSGRVGRPCQGQRARAS